MACAKIETLTCAPFTTSVSPSPHHLRQRARPLTEAELASIPWLAGLEPGAHERARDALMVSEADPGDYLCRVGRPVTYGFGLIDGLLKMSNDDSRGPIMTFTGVAPGGWVGEGTALKREADRCNIQALRRSRVAGLPVDIFHWLLDHSIAFNRFVMNQLNDGPVHSRRGIDRISDPDVRVARSLANLFHPGLFPGVGQVLRITQQELAYLVGLSRQRVNLALAHWERAGAIQVEYSGLRVLDLQALRRAGVDHAAAP